MERGKLIHRAIAITSPNQDSNFAAKTSELCLNTLKSVLDRDRIGDASLELVRLLNRMIKERRFSVHPNVLSCLLHLRLKDELGVKASTSRVDREETNQPKRGKDQMTKGKKKFQPKSPHLSKKAMKAQKERKEIEEEMKEAEADVDSEERSKIVSNSNSQRSEGSD